MAENSLIKQLESVAGQNLYSMKQTQDWDASMWYKGGFRSIALPKCYIVDNDAKKRANGEIATAWNELGFFTSNNSMTKYNAELVREDPEYKRLVSVDKVYGGAQASQEQVEKELYSDDFKGSNQGNAYVNTKIGRAHV